MRSFDERGQARERGKKNELQNENNEKKKRILFLGRHADDDENTKLANSKRKNTSSLFSLAYLFRQRDHAKQTLASLLLQIPVSEGSGGLGFCGRRGGAQMSLDHPIVLSFLLAQRVLFFCTHSISLFLSFSSCFSLSIY